MPKAGGDRSYAVGRGVGNSADGRVGKRDDVLATRAGKWANSQPRQLIGGPRFRQSARTDACCQSGWRGGLLSSVISHAYVHEAETPCHFEGGLPGPLQDYFLQAAHTALRWFAESCSVAHGSRRERDSDAHNSILRYVLLGRSFTSITPSTRSENASSH